MTGKGFYNGFSPAERGKGHAALRVALAANVLRTPATCSVCQQRPQKPLGWHSEDYRRPLEAHATCWRCHYAIHIRFRRPEYWRRYIADLDPSGWFQHLSLDPVCLHRPFDETYPGGPNISLD